MSEPFKHKSGNYVEPFKESLWLMHQKMGIPCKGSGLFFDETPFSVVSKYAHPHGSKLPLKPTKTLREIALAPDVLWKLGRGIIEWKLLRFSLDEFEIAKKVQQAEQEWGKLLNAYNPNDGISGPCDIKYEQKGGYAPAFKVEESALMGDEHWSVEFEEPPIVEELRERAVRLFAWAISMWVRTHDWKPTPPIRIAIKQGRKERLVYDFRAPRDKTIMHCLSVVIQHCIEWPPISHGYVVGRDVHSATDQIKSLLGDGFVWVQTLDMKNAFPSMNRDRVKSVLLAKLEELFSGLEPLPDGHPSVKTRIAQTWEMIWRTVDIKEATDHSGDPQFDVSHEGILQGSSLSPVYFNICFEEMDRAFVPTASGQYAYVRWADNIFLMAKSQKALQSGRNRVRRMCRRFGVEVRCECGPTHLWESPKPVRFLGLCVGIKHGKPTTWLAPSALKQYASTIASFRSRRIREAAVYGLFRHYARDRLLTDAALESLSKWLMAAFAKRGRADGRLNMSLCYLDTLMDIRDKVLGKIKLTPTFCPDLEVS